MKKIVVFILALLFLQFISAVEVDMNEDFGQGETILTKISGNFITPVTKENIFFYRSHVRIPMEYDVARINDDYYIYALLSDKQQGNYSISVEDVKYMKGAEISEENIIKNFSITDKIADFSLKPGFIITSKDFSIEIQNLQDRKLTVNIKTLTNTTANNSREILILPPDSKETSISLKSGEIKEINFKLGVGEPALQKIELKTDNLIYEIPVYILTPSSGGSQKESFRFEPAELNFSLSTNMTAKGIIHLYNAGDADMKNISLSLSDSIKPFANISVSKIENLHNNSNFAVELYFFSLGDIAVEGNLKAETENLTAYSSISLKFLKSYTPSNETEQPPAVVKTCAELQGKICNETVEKCDTTPVYAKDNVCCLGTCQKIKKSSTGRIIAIIFILVIIAGLVWFYFAKYKKTKKPVDLLKIAKGKNP